MHCIGYKEYHCSVSENQILKDLDRWAFDPMETSGYHGHLTFHRNLVLKTREEAEATLERLSRYPYDDHAVMFKDGRKKFWLLRYEYHC